MKTSKYSILTANQAVAKIAYKTNEVFPIYPITPASDMSELVEQWCAENKPNAFEQTPSVFQMQSESGVAGAMHGALQTGALSSTFTASQGLLLMLPNLYKIAGELTPNVIHVATRSLATHALSVFGDHSDVMAVRQSGYAILSSASVQEAQDFALIAQASSLASQIPFIHFFDGFRTSHEINKIETISDKVINALINQNDIKTHKARALTPNAPVIRGTSQGPDVFFQSREAINPHYDRCPNLVQKHMDLFKTLTGRTYKLFDYVGHPEAEYLVITMASSTETIETTIAQLNKQGEKYGLIKVRLFRPFSTKHLIEALPKQIKSIAVLDRTKEPGASGDPLYLDVLQSVSKAFQNNQLEQFPKIIGGRYGLSSKEFTPAMVKAIYNNLKQNRPKPNFTVGIIDDVKNLSLDYSKNVELKHPNYQAIFYQSKHKRSSESLFNTLKFIGNKTPNYVQGYTQCDYKKSNSYNIAHLRYGPSPIQAPYLIDQANFIGCQHAHFKSFKPIINKIKAHGIILVNTSQTSKAFWQSLALQEQLDIIAKNVSLHVVNTDELNMNHEQNPTSISHFHACFLALQSGFINNTFHNLKDYIYQVDTTSPTTKQPTTTTYKSAFKDTLLGQLLEHSGDNIPVSLLPVDGTYPTNTSMYNPSQKGAFLPKWDTDQCTQCGACSMACPQGALRIKAYDDNYLTNAPVGFKHTKSKDFNLLNYTIDIHPDQCNSCNHCIEACPSNALSKTNTCNNLKDDTYHWNFFESIPEFDRSQINPSIISEQQLQEPLFKYSTGVEGCGEAPYLKLLSQLFGDRLLIANATGASSIFGGALPTTPWAQNTLGQGPAWSNSLFEDNAEFGLGFRMSLNQNEKQSKTLLNKLSNQLPLHLVTNILNNKQLNEVEIIKQRQNVALLKSKLKSINTIEARLLLNSADSLIKQSVWIVGGDGWAYDIGYGGIDHVLASGENVNILVLDNEVYDNTGAQASKATPFGAQAKFAFAGKQKQKKDLGKLAMTYTNVYVASVAIGADQEQTLRAFNEAESFNGPSLIVAYSQSESHGIDMKHPQKYHKAAVNSGQWVLYRNNPERCKKGLNPFILDSDIPSIKIEAYLRLEKRFSKLLNGCEITLRNHIKTVQKQVDLRFDSYLSKSLEPGKVNRSQLLQQKKIRQQLSYNKK
ncbi:4Fe-4S binding protein [Cognatitamlana onchidii]|uniref:4Fe-4S binding protein n=1 Tax=Cognatitamlana onchidii TaxID=2562860 RepID=UPI0010A60DB9|nr:4Fe-4S binding protein [Algibacter onchidii]